MVFLGLSDELISYSRNIRFIKVVLPLPEEPTIPTLSFLSFNRLRAHDLYYARKIIMLESAAKNLSEFYAEEKEAK